MKWIKQLVFRIRLYRIEHALGLRLRQNQLDYIFKGNPDILWGNRRNGKTVAVVVMILLFQKAPIRNRSDFLFAMSDDPDLFKNVLWHFGELWQCNQICKAHHIRTFQMDKTAYQNISGLHRWERENR